MRVHRERWLLVYWMWWIPRVIEFLGVGVVGVHCLLGLTERQGEDFKVFMDYNLYRFGLAYHASCSTDLCLLID